MALAYSRIGLRVAAPAAVVAAALVGGLHYTQTRDSLRRGNETLDVYADLLNRLVLSDLREGMVAKDNERIGRELARIGETAPIRSLRIVDKQGKVVFASDPKDVGTTMLRTEPSCAGCHKNGGAPKRGAHSLRFTDGETHIYRAVQPITLEEACARCHDGKEGTVLGVLITDLDDDALTGELRADTKRTAWSIALSALLLVLIMAALIWRQVVSRLRNLRLMLDLLRTGARASVLSVSSADEIDEVTRAVQALTLDLDGRVALERAGRRLASVLERQAGPVLLLDAAGFVAAANGLAAARLAAGRPLVGQQRASFPGLPEAMLADAREQGWALPAEGEDGPALFAMASAAGDITAFLEIWPDGSGTPLPADGEAATSRAETQDWLLYGTVLAESIRPAQQGGPTVLRFDARLARARRLATEVAALGTEAAAEREEVDLKSLGLILLWDLEREMPAHHWHVLRDVTQRVPGVRYQLRALLYRLARAAGRQAGDHGHVVLFTQCAPGQNKVFAGAWASAPGGQTLLDPPDGPTLARAIAVAHGGGVEVDPAFDIGEMPGFAALRLACPAQGTLFVAELAMRADAKPRARPMA